jgi:hypothetical protein
VIIALGLAGRSVSALSSPPPFTVYDDEWNEFRFPPPSAKHPFYFLYFETVAGLKKESRKGALQLLERACSDADLKLPVVVLLGAGITYAEVTEFRQRYPRCLRFYLVETSPTLMDWIARTASTRQPYPKSLLVSASGAAVVESRSPMYALSYFKDFGEGPENPALAISLQEMVDAIESGLPRWQTVLARLRALPENLPRRTLLPLLSADAFRFKSGGVPDSYATLLNAYDGGTPYILDHFLDSLLREHITLFFRLDSFDPLDQITTTFNTALKREPLTPLIITSAAYLNLVTGKPDDAEAALRRFPRNHWDAETYVLSALTLIYQGQMTQGMGTVLGLLDRSEKPQDVLRDILRVLLIMGRYHSVRGRPLPTGILVMRVAVEHGYGYRDRQGGGLSTLRLCAERNDRWGEFCRANLRNPHITFADIRKAAS